MLDLAFFLLTAEANELSILEKHNLVVFDLFYYQI